MYAIPVVGIFRSKIPMVGIKNSWFFKLLKVYLANLKFEEDTLCPQGLCMPTSQNSHTLLGLHSGPFKRS
jgi:hypothetical protein